MAAVTAGRVIIFALLCSLPSIFGQENALEIEILPLKPKGIRVSTPDKPRTNLFAFQGRINRRIGDDDVGDISEEATRSKNGYWTIQNDSVELKVGDVIHYYAIAIRNRKEYRVKNQYTVTALIDPTQPSVPPPTAAPVIPSPITVPPSTSGSCKSTSTIIMSAPSGFSTTACANNVIFEDNFDNLRGDFWTIEHYVPLKPEYPFVSYQRLPNDPTVYVKDGILHIEPKLQETLPGFDSSAIITSKLDLTIGCTRVGFCEFKSEGGQILPPIASGRITNKFVFKYGVIEVRAKVPQGDWLYPDIVLESMINKFGSDHYASGVMRVAGVLGNIALNSIIGEFGNKVLYGGPMMDFQCRKNLLVNKIADTEWGNDFHVYSLRWGPDMITLSVDEEEWGRIEPPASGLQARLPRDTCPMLPRTFLNTPMAPFDDFFSLALGVGVGGISEFPDYVTSGSAPKPWVNSNRRARLNFFNAKDTWLSTWTQPALLVDYVRVRAL